MAAAAEELDVDGIAIRFTNPDKIYFPELGSAGTKRKLVEYYLAVARGPMLTALRDRPTRRSVMKYPPRPPTSAPVSVLRPEMNRSWFVPALAWNMGAFRRNPAALVQRNETNDILARVDHQFLEY